MQWVQKPGRYDVVKPYSRVDPDGYYIVGDFDGATGSQRIVITNEELRKTAREWPSRARLAEREKLDSLVERVRLLTISLNDARERAQRAEDHLERIDALTKDDVFTTRHKQGRPTTKKVTA